MRIVKYLIVSILFVVCSLQVQAVDYDALASQAQEQYSNGEYEKAIELYQQVEANGKQAFELFYNMGNCFYKTGKYPKAILYYEKAKKLNADDEDLLYNLALANQFVVDKFDQVPTLTVTKWYQNFVNSLASNSWAGISLVSFLILLVCAGAFFTVSSLGLKKASLSIGIVMLLLSLFSFIFSSQQKGYSEQLREAIVFASSITVKSTPDKTGTELFVLHEGTKVTVVEALDKWRKIKMSDGNVGWVPSDAVEVI